MIKTVYFFVIFSITEKSKILVIMKVRKTQGHNQAQNLVIANVKELEAAAKLTSQQNGQVSIANVSPTTSQTTTAQLNHGLVVSPVAQTTSISAGSLKTADVLLSNVHLVSAIQSPVIWPADGILRQALMGSEKNLKGGEKIGVITESTLPADQVASPSATLVAISMTPQAPLFTSSVPQQVIMVGELGANQIILAGPSLPHVSSEVGDSTCKQIGVETTRIDLEQNAPDLLVIDDHNSFNALNVGTSTSTSVGSNSNPIQIKAGFSLMQNKVFSPSQNSRSDVHIVPHNHSDDIPDLINENHDDSMHNNNHHDDVGEEEEEEEDDEDDNSGGNNERDSFQQENRVSEVEQHSADGSGELGYTAHLLSQLSGTGALPTMSSSQVSSVLSALEPTEKSAQSNIGSLELVASKQRKSTLNNDLHPAPPSLEFVKIENNVPEIPKTTKTTSKSFEANKSAISMRCKVVVLSTNQGSKHTVFKCLDCGYLSLKENVMGNHCQRAHLLQLHHLINNKKRQLKCIGCNNIFYSKNALQVHLIQDHEVCVSEVALMVAAISDRAEKQDIDDHNKSVLPERNRLTTIVDDVCSDKETLLYSSSHKCSDTAASVPLNSVITTAVVQPVTTFPAVQLIMSSTSHTVSTPSLAVSATGKRPTLAPPPPSPLSIPVPTSLPLPLPPPPAASPAPQPSIQTPQFEGFVTEADPTFTDQRIDKNSLMESKTEALQDQNMLKDERELEEVPLEETSDAVNSITVNSCDNQSKKRGRPRGSQTLRLVRSKFKSSDVIKIEKDLGFRCGTDGCAVRLQRETNMIYHKQCHTEKYSVTLKCPECSHIATRWSSLTSHLWKMHNIDMELYSCNQCGYKTNSHSKLVNLHSRIHRDERPFLCDLCGKGFKTPKQLRNHKAIHKSRGQEACGEPVRLLSCNICGRQVSDARNLRHHTENVHNKRRPYHCSFCGYTAASRSSLRMHSRQHTGEKPFSCEECGYTTADHNSLRRHKMRHSGNKPYQCPHCSYACIQSTTYKAHLKNKHPGLDEGLMFSCPACPFRTVKKDNFLAHTAEHTLNGSLNDDKLGQQRKLCNSNSINITNLVKQVSSSILPTTQLDVMVNDSTPVSLHQRPNLVSLGIKDDIALGRSHTAADNDLPVAGLAHGEIIISDPLTLEDSETESMNGELIVPERQGSR